MYHHTTILIDKKLLTKLKDYAYTERITQTEAINRALRSFLADKKELLHKEVIR